MKPEIKEIINYRIEKAKSDLYSSEILFNTNQLVASINRSYYAIFHAARALCAFKNFNTKTHSGVISFFNKEFVKTGEMDISMSKFISSTERIRIQNDYDDFYVVSNQQAKQQIDNAKLFINTIENYIKTKTEN